MLPSTSLRQGAHLTCAGVWLVNKGTVCTCPCGSCTASTTARQHGTAAITVWGLSGGGWGGCYKTKKQHRPWKEAVLCLPQTNQTYEALSVASQKRLPHFPGIKLSTCIKYQENICIQAVNLNRWIFLLTVNSHELLNSCPLLSLGPLICLVLIPGFHSFQKASNVILMETENNCKYWRQLTTVCHTACGRESSL